MENVVPDLTQGLLVSRDSDEHHHHHEEEEEEEEDSNIVTESKIKNRGFSLRNISSSSNGKGRVKIRDFDTAMLFVSASLKGRSHKIRVDNAFSVRCYRWFHSKMWRQIVGFACTVYIIIPVLIWPLKFDSYACLWDGFCLIVLITDVIFDLNTVPFKENDEEGRCERTIRFLKSLVVGEDTHNILAVRMGIMVILLFDYIFFLTDATRKSSAIICSLRPWVFLVRFRNLRMLMVFSHVTLRKVSVYLLLVVQIVFFGILGDLLFDNCTGKKDETCLDGSGQFLKLQDSFYNSMLLITSAPQAIPMQGPLVSQARWPMVYFVSFLFIGRVLLFKLITVSSMQIFKFTIEDAYLKRLSHRKRSARVSFQMLRDDDDNDVVTLETWRNIYITWHEHDVGFIRAIRNRISEYHDPESSTKRIQFRKGIANKLFRDVKTKDVAGGDTVTESQFYTLLGQITNKIEVSQQRMTTSSSSIRSLSYKTLTRIKHYIDLLAGIATVLVMIFVDNVDDCALRDSHKVFFYLCLLIFIVEVVLTILASGVEKYTKFSSRTKKLFPNLEIANVAILTFILITQTFEGNPVYVECGAPTVSGIAIQIAIVFRAFLGGARRLYISSKTYRILFESVSQSSSWIRRCLLVYFCLVYSFAMYSVYLLDDKICCSQYYRDDHGLNVTASVLDENWAYSMDFSTFPRSFGSMVELVMLSGWPTLMNGAESNSPQGLGDLSSRTFFFTYKLLFYLLVQPMMAGFMIQCVMTAWNEFERRHRFLDALKNLRSNEEDVEVNWRTKVLNCLKCCFCVARNNLNEDTSREYREWEEDEEEEKDNDDNNDEDKRESWVQRQDSRTIRVIRKRRKSEILRRMVAYHRGEVADDDGVEEQKSKESPRDLMSKISHLERVVQEQSEIIEKLQTRKRKARRRALRHHAVVLEHSLIRELDHSSGNSEGSWDGSGLM